MAMPVTVEPGGVVEGVDILLIRRDLSTMRMRVTPDPATLTDLQINVIAVPSKRIRSVKLSDEGQASVAGVIDGRYAVWARARRDGEWVAVVVMVDFVADTPELPLALEPVGRLSGRVVSARGGVPPVGSMRVEASLVHDGQVVDPLSHASADVSADGRFEFEGAFGPRRLSLTALPAGWSMRQILVGRQDVTRSDIDIRPGAATEVVLVLDR
jgi:hypothetical protein